MERERKAIKPEMTRTDSRSKFMPLLVMIASVAAKTTRQTRLVIISVQNCCFVMTESWKQLLQGLSRQDESVWTYILDLHI
jgi:hypothetical protein